MAPYAGPAEKHAAVGKLASRRAVRAHEAGHSAESPGHGAGPGTGPAGPAAAEPVTGTGFDNMITDATAASSSVLVTDSCMRATCPVFFVCTRKSALYGRRYKRI